MARTFQFPCTYCDGTGTYRVPTDAPWKQGREESCECCQEGVIELSAADAFEEAVSRLTTSRNLFHLNWKGNRMVAWKHHTDACHWLKVAREADSVIATEEHSGTAHIGRAA